MTQEKSPNDLDEYLNLTKNMSADEANAYLELTQKRLQSQDGDIRLQTAKIGIIITFFALIVADLLSASKEIVQELQSANYCWKAGTAMLAVLMILSVIVSIINMKSALLDTKFKDGPSLEKAQKIYNEYELDASIR